MKTLFFSLISLVVSSTPVMAGGSSFFAPGVLAPSIQKAHQSFLNGDFTSLANYIKEGLIEFNGNPEVEENLLALYDKAYETKGDRALAPDWKMPNEMIWMAVGSRHSHRVAQNVYRNSINVSLNFRAGEEIEQIRIAHYPDQVLIDLQAHVGYTEPANTETDGSLSRWAQSESTPGTNPSGLYLFDFKFKGKPLQHAWFIMSHLNASASQEVLVPQLNQVFSVGDKLDFQWKDFQSPEYRHFEERRLTTSVNQGDESVETEGYPSPLPEHYSVVKALSAGSYAFKTVFKERHHFGDLVVGRESDTSIPFSVK
jgi:hypothetical protein